MVFQSYALFNHKTVAQNIAFGLEVCEYVWVCEGEGEGDACGWLV